MKERFLDVVILILALALATTIIIPIVVHRECMTPEALEVWEKIMMAVIAIVAGYCGAMTSGKRGE